MTDNGEHYLTPGMCDVYIVMMAMPWYFTPDAGCPSLSNIIHNGHQVNKPGGFTCCLETTHQEGLAHQTSNV